ncbi:sensor histidine kinase [Demequina sp. NBRC 110056]|uniref:sensor histidine kinase n=1 Tax=Demequina sp. NBRC 110056 TaxID=1570345 RepID=UPI00135668FE|nr:sensor histidine kinase [Demequina sp. NBRC 110056]
MRAIGRYFAVTWSPRTWREIAYLLLGLPFAIVWFTYAVTMYAVGIGLIIVWVGVVILAVMQWTLRPIGELERGMANAIVDADIEAPPPRGYRIHEKGSSPTLSDWGTWGHALLHDGQSWRVLAWVMSRIVLGPVGFALALCAIVVPVTLIAAWIIAAGYVVGILPGPGPGEETAQQVVDIVAFWTLVGTPVVAFAVPMFAWVSHHFTALTTAFARWALGPCDEDRVAHATERAELAETQVRIDQELHDSIGHMITMNIVQAGAGAHVFDSDPEFARQALRNIEERGRVAMGELDRIIAAIRGDDAEPRAPLPTLDDVPSLLAQASAAGLEIERRLDARTVPVALSRAGYAIIREGVTNAAKHAPGAVIHVHTATLGDALAIGVTNGAAGAGAEPIAAVRHARPGIRHGIAGIRDRAALLGGTSVIGDRGDGGYEVMVLIPLELALGPGDAAEDASCCRWSRARAKVSA